MVLDVSITDLTYMLSICAPACMSVQMWGYEQNVMYCLIRLSVS